MPNSQAFKGFFAFPKWARVFLAVLSSVAVVALCGALALQNYAKGREFSANLTFHDLEEWRTQQIQAGILKLDLPSVNSSGNSATPSTNSNSTENSAENTANTANSGKSSVNSADNTINSSKNSMNSSVNSTENSSKSSENFAQSTTNSSKNTENSAANAATQSANTLFSYKAKVHFESLAFLLRSRTIANIDIKDISWSEKMSKVEILSVKSENRYISFISTQSPEFFDALKGENLGVLSYQINFSPLFVTIFKYYGLILAVFFVIFNVWRILAETDNKFIAAMREESLPHALYQGYKGINPLYRHTFWAVFIITNLVFGFHTVQFLWGNHDWGAVLYGYGITSEIYMGRYTQNLISLSLQGGMMLPFLNNILAFLGLAFAVVLLCEYLNLHKKLWIWLIAGLIFTLQPFTFTRLYYAFQVAGLFIALAIGILGFLLAKKAGEISAIAGGGGDLTECFKFKAKSQI